MKAATTVTVVLIGLLAVILFAAIAIGGVFATAYNYGIATEQQIEAKWKDNQNVLSNYSQTLIELAQVPEMYREDFTQLVKADMEGRYGEDGSTAMMQWIQERGLNFDSSLYANIQQPIEAGRKDFANNQRQLLDMKRVYQTELDSFPRNFAFNILGFPKIDLDKYNAIVTADTARKFETGVDEAVQIRRPAAAPAAAAPATAQ